MRRLRKLNERKRRKDKDSYVGGWDIKLPANDIKEKKKTHSKCIDQKSLGFFLMTICLFLLDKLMIKVLISCCLMAENRRHFLCFQLSTNSNDQLKVTSHLYALRLELKHESTSNQIWKLTISNLIIKTITTKCLTKISAQNIFESLKLLHPDYPSISRKVFPLVISSATGKRQHEPPFMFQ